MTVFMLLIVLSGGALWDLRTGKVLNGWILFGAAGGLPLSIGPAFGSERFCIGAAVSLAAFYLLRILFFLLLFFPLFLFRMMGAGDCKLLALIGGYLGVCNGCTVIFYGFLAAGVWSGAVMLHRRMLTARIRYLFSYLKLTLVTGRLTPYYCAARDGPAAVLALAPFFLIGYLLWLIRQTGGFFL